jgi:hypothetical protein
MGKPIVDGGTAWSVFGVAAMRTRVGVNRMAIPIDGTAFTGERQTSSHFPRKKGLVGDVVEAAFGSARAREPHGIKWAFHVLVHSLRIDMCNQRVKSIRWAGTPCPLARVSGVMTLHTARGNGRLVREPGHSSRGCLDLAARLGVRMLHALIAMFHGDRTPLEGAVGGAGAILVGIMPLFQATVPARAVFEMDALHHGPI